MEVAIHELKMKKIKLEQQNKCLLIKLSRKFLPFPIYFQLRNSNKEEKERWNLRGTWKIVISVFGCRSKRKESLQNWCVYINLMQFPDICGQLHFLGY